MIEIKFPAGDAVAALVFGNALLDYAGQQPDREHFFADLTPEVRVPSARFSRERQDDGSVKVVPTHPDDAALPVATVVQTSAGHVPHTALSTADSEAAHAGDPSRLDLKGVAFDAKYCANAQDPFYASGKESGQWKAKRGLAAGVYEQWYAQQLATVQPAQRVLSSEATPTVVNEETDPTPPVATATAFGAVQQQQVAAPVVRTAGELMAWVSEKQVAGKLTQAVIDDAYRQLGIRVQDLFVGTEAVIANNVAALYNYLAPTAGA